MTVECLRLMGGDLREMRHARRHLLSRLLKRCSHDPQCFGEILAACGLQTEDGAAPPAPAEGTDGATFDDWNTMLLQEIIEEVAGTSLPGSSDHTWVRPASNLQNFSNGMSPYSVSLLPALLPRRSPGHPCKANFAVSMVSAGGRGRHKRSLCHSRLAYFWSSCRYIHSRKAEDFNLTAAALKLPTARQAEYDIPRGYHRQPRDLAPCRES